MVASHTGAVAIHSHIRSKPEEVIRAIADTGGYAGVFSVVSFLGRNGDLNAMLDHIEYLVKRFGADHVAIGTDLAYMPKSADAEWGKVGPRPKERPGYEALGLTIARYEGQPLQSIGTMLEIPAGKSYAGLADTLANTVIDGHVFEIYSAQGKLSDRYFRLFHMGDYPLEAYRIFLRALARALA